MTSTAADFGTFHISTTDLPARDRLAAWREYFGRKVLRLDFEPLPDVPFHVEMTLRTLPALDMTSVRSSPMRVLRTKELVADGDDGFSLGFASAGGAIVSGRGRELTLNDSDTVLASWAESATFVHPVPLRFISLNMSRAALTPLVRNVDDAVMRLIPRNIEALRLLTSYVNVLGDSQALATPELAAACCCACVRSGGADDRRDAGRGEPCSQAAACAPHGCARSRPTSSTISRAPTCQLAPSRRARASRHVTSKCCSRSEGTDLFASSYSGSGLSARIAC